MVTIQGLPAAAVRMMGLTGAQVKYRQLNKFTHTRAYHGPSPLALTLFFCAFSISQRLPEFGLLSLQTLSFSFRFLRHIPYPRRPQVQFHTRRRQLLSLS